MKKKLVLLGLILVSSIITGLKIIPENPKQTSPSPSSIIPPPNIFLIGAIQMEKHPEYYVKCDELKFNIRHN